MYDSQSDEQKGRFFSEREEGVGGASEHNQGEGGPAPTPRTEKEVIAYIYGLKCPKSDNVLYVGKSVNPKSRYRTHCCDVSSYPSAKWIATLRAEGLKPILVILEEVPIAEWKEAERKWIRHFKSLGVPLVNISEGGNGSTLSHEEGRKKISEKMKGRTITPEHRASLSAANKGKRPSDAAIAARAKAGYSDEWRKKVSESKKGKKRAPSSPESIKKAADARRGWKMSEEQKAKLRGPRNLSPETRGKMRQAKLGKKLSAEHCAKLSKVRKGRKGRPMTPEHKAKLIALHLGKPWSEASKKKLRATMIATNAVSRLHGGGRL